jgi:hypothetical protein
LNQASAPEVVPAVAAAPQAKVEPTNCVAILKPGKNSKEETDDLIIIDTPANRPPERFTPTASFCEFQSLNFRFYRKRKRDADSDSSSKRTKTESGHDLIELD